MVAFEFKYDAQNDSYILADVFLQGVNLSVPGSYQGKPVTVIGEKAFSSFHFEEGSLVIPEGVERIENSAFKSTGGYNSLILPKSLKYIGESAFEDAGDSIEKLVIPNSVEEIGKNAFCDFNVKEVEIEEGTKLTQIQKNTFGSAYYLEKIYIPSQIVSIKDYAFSNNSRLKTVEFGLNSQIKEIGDYAFSRCTMLKDFDFESLTQLKTIGYEAFYETTAFGDVALPTGLQYIAPGAFIRSGITSIYLPNTITDFYDKNNVIGDIRTDTFKWCENLHTVTFEQGINLPVVPGYMFYSCNELQNITLPQSTTQVLDYAFAYCKKLSTANLQNVVVIGDRVFEGSGISSISFSSNITDFGDSIFSLCESLSSVTIPEGYVAVGENMFANCSALTTVNLPSTLQEISRGMFGRCTSLSQISLPANVTKIGDWAFEGCTSLSGIDLSYVTQICQGAFKECTSITSVVISSGVEDISHQAFEGCEKLSQVTLPNTIKEIDNSAFKNCTSLTQIQLNAGLKEIATGAFEGTALTSVVIPQGVVTIGNNAFAKCENLQSVVLNSDLKAFEGGFEYCPKLQYIVLPISVETITAHVLDGMWQYTKVLVEATSKQPGWSENWYFFYDDSHVYYYSESQPADGAKAWRYVNGQPTFW